MLIASALLPHNRALSFPPHLLLIFLWLCFSSPKCFLTQVCSASQFCSLLHYPLWAMLLQVFFHQKISSVSGFHHLQEQDLKMKQYPIFISFRTSTHLNSHLSLVSLDVPSIVPRNIHSQHLFASKIQEKSRSSFHNLGRKPSAEDWLPIAVRNKLAALVYMKKSLYCYLALSSLPLPPFFLHLLHIVIAVGER